MDSIPYVDALFKEYLLFRGFTKTLQTFSTESASDKGCGLQAEQISDLVFGSLIPRYEGSELIELLNFLRTHIFSRLQSDLEDRTSKLELSVLRLFVVNAIDSGRSEVVQQLFTAFGEKLTTSSEAGEWEPWFAVPFLSKPQAHPRFQVYFTKPWKQLVEASFRNFMATAVSQLPLPAVLRFNTDRKQRKALQSKVAVLQAELDRMRSKSRAPEAEDLGADDPGLRALPLSSRRSSSSWTDLAVSGSRPSRSQTTRADTGPENEGMAAASPNPNFPQTPEWDSRSQGSDSLATEPPTPAAFSSADAAMAAETELQDQLVTAAQILEVSLPPSEMSDSESGCQQQDQPSPGFTEPQQGLPDAGTEALNPQAPESLAQSRSASETAHARLQVGPVGESLHLPQILGASSHGRGGAKDEQTTAWSVVGKQEVLRGHEAAVNDTIVAPDGRNVASASADGVVRIWAPSTLSGNPERSAVLLCGASVQRLAWDTRADKVMLMGTEGKGVKAWHLDTKRMVAHMRPDPVFPNVLDLACSPTDPSFLCSSSAKGDSKEGRLTLWNLRAFRKIHAFKGDFRLPSVCFSPDGRTIATASENGGLRLFDTNTTVSTGSLTIGEGPSFVRFVGPAGTSLLTLSPNGVLRGWDLAMLRSPTWTKDLSVSCEGSYGSLRHQRFASSANGVAAALTSSSSTGYIVSGLFREEVQVQVHSAAVHRGPVLAIAWHPNDNIVVSGSADRTLIITHLADF